MTESCHFNDKNSLGGSFCVWRGGSIMATTRIMPPDDSLLKMLYLATMDITKKWTGHRQDWGQIHSQL